MGASSVTGVGLGSAENLNRGRKDFHIGVERLLGPRVMCAAIKALSGGAGTVVLPKLPGVVADYVVLVSDASGTAAATSGTLTFNTNDTTVTLAGTGSNSLHWAVVKVGPAYV